MKEKLLNYDYPQQGKPSLIKVIGVGGGGGNAVENMFEYGITTDHPDANNPSTQEVTFLLCNTDRQALEYSKIPNTLILGPQTTSGLGAGNKPDRAKEAAQESADELRTILDDNSTRMVFVTAGMGGGTGTGAAPVVGRVARDLGILTVGIVTIPFIFEGRNKILQAIKGVEEIRKNVDALLVINNERLRFIYPDLTLNDAFKKADETLRNAACGISELITRRGTINLDFADVNTTLKDGGIAIISTGFGSGENRLQHAIDDALTSPLLNNNDIFKARRILINLYQSSTDPLNTDEITAVHELMGKMENSFDTIWGYATDDSLGGQIKITILASGFDINTTKDSLRQNAPITADDISTQEVEMLTRQENDLIGSYYGSERLQQTVCRPVILSLEELDNDELIYELDDTPTLTRRMDHIDEIRRRILANSPIKASESTASDYQVDTESSTSTRTQTIRFN